MLSKCCIAYGICMLVNEEIETKSLDGITQVGGEPEVEDTGVAIVFVCLPFTPIDILSSFEPQLMFFATITTVMGAHPGGVMDCDTVKAFLSIE
ncbi:hypothetical protein PsorP6_010973 [Peronosclerospora sorghi]|uniref:Uncharacterized protein n=1 Tax=Peronosclerospora sorghi TaxID=230839 RepID=A0ACC0VVQ9_9STRA|nr:hypothetical protein PsorP6_010973 [Peronosclerospora sorghi]